MFKFAFYNALLGGANQYALPAIAGEFTDRYRGRISKVRNVQAGSTARRGRERNAGVGEKHSFYSTPYSANDVGGVFGIQHVNAVPTGTDVGSRIANKIRARALAVNFSVTAGATQTAPVLVRVMVVKDKGPRGALPASTDIIRTESLYALPAILRGDRFTIVYDKTFSIVGDGDALTGSLPQVYRSLYFPLRGVCEWDAGDTTGAIAGVAKNAYYVCCLGDTADTGTNVPKITALTKFDFTE